MHTQNATKQRNKDGHTSQVLEGTNKIAPEKQEKKKGNKRNLCNGGKVN